MTVEAEIKDQKATKRRKRRRKDGEAQNAGMKLVFPDWVHEKFPKTDFRVAWIRDDAGRVLQKHNEDWDPIEGVDPVPGAFDRHGNPVNHIAVVKRRDWVQEDRDKKEVLRKQIEDQTSRGNVSGQGDDKGAGLAQSVSYTDGANRLR